MTQTPPSRTGSAPMADLVLEGGGVKGIALVGAIETLAEAGYSYARIGGSSAGAMVGAVLAAMQRSGEPVSRLGEITRTLDYRKFRDRGFPGRWLGPLGFLTDGLGVLFEDGAYEGDYLREWLGGVLGEFGVSTFGDLRIEDSGGDGGIHHRYGLVVTASDVSRRRLLKLPWDYPDYGLDPDEQSVAEAVRASASIPYFFEPVQLTGREGTSTLVDGGLLSNYPISIFDRMDEQTPRWPTIGVRLDALGLESSGPVHPVRGPLPLGVSLVATAIEGCQAEHVLEPCNLSRSIFVETHDVSAIDFSISRKQQAALLAAGQQAARRFLVDWDWQAWLRRCRAG